MLRENILHEYANTDFNEAVIINNHSVKESARIDNTRSCHFHKSHGHNADEGLHLKDASDELIKMVMLTQYIKEDGREYDCRRKK